MISASMRDEVLRKLGKLGAPDQQRVNGLRARVGHGGSLWNSGLGADSIPQEPCLKSPSMI
jgi:hypothetical protein